MLKALSGEFETALEKEIAGFRKIVILGVGSEFHGDDCLGLLAVRELNRLISSHRDQLHPLKDRFQIFDTGTAPENFTGAIRKAAPSHVLIIDAARMGKEPGFVKIIKPNEIKNTAFSSHAMPLSILANYLKQEMGCKVIVIGVQPQKVLFGEGISPPIRRVIEGMADIIFAQLLALAG